MGDCTSCSRNAGSVIRLRVSNFLMLRFVRPNNLHWLATAGLVIAVTLVLAGCGGAIRKSAAPISAADLAVLAPYDAVRAALADDDMTRTRLAAAKLLKAIDSPGVSSAVAKTKAAAKALSETFRIDLARSAFKEISGALEPICEGAGGFYVFSSSLVPDGTWIQTTKDVSNPYLGRAMSTFGEIKR